MVMKRVIMAVAALMSLASAAQAQDAGKQARDAALSNAVQAVADGRAQDAIKLVDPLLGQYERLYASQATPFYCDTTEPESAAYKALPGGSGAKLVDSGWCVALWAKGFAMIDLDQLDAAVPFLERAVALSPLHPHYLSELGYAYQSQKKWQPSYDVYARAADNAGKFETGEKRGKSLRRAWFGMGFDLIELGKLDEAEVMMKKCLELVPDDQKVKDELDYIREQRGKAKTS
jgi:tetratricopeptide (TPR) repeat protein